MKPPVLLVAAVLAYPTGLAWAGDIYKTVDAQGHVIYSDQAVAPSSQTVVDSGAINVNADADVRASEAPPPLPDYQQPACPEEGYLWTPGYWAWGPGGYYWVPGAWVQPPRVGVLWTPGYWGYVDAVYFFHRGYWAPHIGYYGGVNYGFGYFGAGFAGGHWVGNAFAYNRAVSNVGEHFHNLYHEEVENAGPRSRVSFNGGPGGTHFAPTAQERAFAAEAHIAPTSLQRQSVLQAASAPTLVHQTPFKAAQPAPGVMHASAPAVSRPAGLTTPSSAIARANTAGAASVSHREVAPPPPRVVPQPRPAVTRTTTTTTTRTTTSTHAAHPLH